MQHWRTKQDEKQGEVGPSKMFELLHKNELYV